MSLSSPHRTTGEMITASIWNTDFIDPLNSLAVSTDGGTWNGRVVSQPTAAAVFNTSYSASFFAPVIMKYSSGTHPTFAAVEIDPPVIGAGGATVTTAITLLVNGGPAGAGTNYALAVLGGQGSTFQGPIAFFTDVNQGLTFSDTRVTGVVGTSVAGYIGPASEKFVVQAVSDSPLALGVANQDVMTITSANVTINLHGSDTEYVTLQSTDVAHGFTTDTAAATFGIVKKSNATAGGLNIQGYSESILATQIDGLYSTGDTSKDDEASGAVMIRAAKLSGTSHNVMGANENLLVLRNEFETEFIFSNDGHLYYNGAAPTSYDEFDDVALARCLDLTLRGPSVVDSQFDKFVQYNRSDLERAGIVSAGGFVDMTAHTKLLNGAIWQLFTSVQHLTERVAQLEAA